jgi:ketosteroid isomerase-like protein
MRAAQVAVWPETERFVRDLRSKNVPDEVALFTPDAVFIDPGHHVTGTRSIRALCEKVAATFDSDIALTAQRHVNAGRLDFETGTFRENLRVRKTGHVQPYRGTYTFTLRRDADGRRRFSRMLWAITPASS